MGFISDIDSEDKVSIDFQSKGVSLVNGVPGPIAFTSVKKVDGLMWFGGSSVSFISDKLKTQVDGVVSIDYDSTIAALGDNCRIVANSINYEVLYIENVGNQNEVLEVPFRREPSN